jgi:hypothetical protein
VRVERTRRIIDQHATADMLQYDMNAFAEDNSRLPLDVALAFESGEGI